MNFFKLYVGDYQRDTAHLSVTEHGAYLLMLQHYYATEKPLPSGKPLHRMLRAQTRVERDAIDVVAGQFWIMTADGLVNERAQKEFARAEHQREVNRTVGKLGGRPKQQKTESVSESVSERKPKANPNQTPDTKHSEPNGSGADAPTPRDLVFANGVVLLTAAGVKESNARSFLAAQCKAHGEPAVLVALGKCATERPIQPVSWLQAALGAVTGNKPRKADDLMAGNIAAGRRYLEEHTHD